MSRTCIIGDVHGMTGMLEALVDKLALGTADTLISVGDLVDKGPDPAGTVRYLRTLKETASFEVVLIAANHEDRHLRYRRNLAVRPNVARQQAETAPELVDLMAELDEADWAFLETGVPFHRLEDLGVLIVHGGIPGNMKSFPASPEAMKQMSGKEARWFGQILRTRVISAEGGRFLAMGQEVPGDPFWAEVYDGRFGHVVFGHQPWFDGPTEFPYATGIDTGAVDGGALTALVLEEGSGRSYVSVPHQV